MPISSDNMLLEAALKRELQHIAFMIDGKIEASHSLEILIKVTEYLNDRLESLSE